MVKQRIALERKNLERQERLFGEIRSVLQGHASAGAWRKLCELVERWPPSSFSTQLSPYLCGGLEQWPEALRVIPQRWVDALLQRADVPWCEIACVLDVAEQRLSLEELQVLTRASSLANVRRVDVSFNDIGQQGAALLAQAPYWTGLTHLRAAGCAFGEEGCGAFARAPWALHLEALSLEDNALGATSLITLFALPSTWTRLKSLNVSANSVSQGLMKQLGQLQALEHLNLDQVELGQGVLGALGSGFAKLKSLDISGNRFGEEGLSGLSTTESLGSLRRLVLRRCNLNVQDIVALMRTSWCTQLTSLDLSYNRLGDQGVWALNPIGHVLSLKKLVMQGCLLGPQAADYIRRSSWFEHASYVDLANNRLAGPGVERLFEQAHVPCLETLNLSSNAVGPRGIRALTGARSIGALRTLDLSRNPLGLKGATLLSSWTQAERLTTLCVRGTSLDAVGVAALCDGEFHALRTLHLGSNSPGDQGVKVLAQAPWFKTLHRLNMGECMIGDEGARALQETPFVCQLRELHWPDNQLGAQGAQWLASSAHLSSLQVLDLSNNQLGDQGACALAHAPWSVGLRELKLGSNQIGSKGVRALAEDATLPALELLDLEHNQIDDEGGVALAHALHMTSLLRLQLNANSLGASAMLALLCAQGLHRLERLSLVANTLSAHDARALMDELWAPSLRKVYLWWNSLGKEGRRVILSATMRANTRKAELTMTG